MNGPAQPSELSRLLDVALDLPAEERAAWIESLDSSHDTLKPRLRALLARAAAVESGDFLDTMAPLPADSENQDASPEEAGARVGPYRLERPLGAGGMGSVWLASRADGLFERQVALKLPHRGIFGADLVERMARERSILAALEHPHIARLYDAGLAEDGQPYLALEYVEGVAIDEYCRRHDCDLRTRLRLFVQVADAVAAAHARLIVHRDLKPANILVTREGYVRLLDFGIAKLLGNEDEPRGRLTQLSVHALTPDYASPEQIRGELVTIASDVYSLGVVLYELLCGERPYRLKRETRGALEDAILEVTPRRPSEVSGRRALRGDLDTIVLKALNKVPGERYATVNAFADDLRRHLAGLPVHALPATGWYRASRFLRRHAIGSLLAFSVTAAILAAAGVAIVQAQRATSERQRAEDVSRFVQTIFTSADPYAGGGRELGAVDLLRQARARVDKDFASRPAQRVELLNTIALSLANLNDSQTADEVSVNALAIARSELPPGDPRLREARIVRLAIHRAQSRNEDLRREVDGLLAEANKDPSFSAADRIRLLVFSAHAAIDEGRNDVAATQAGEAFTLASRALDEHDPLTLEAASAASTALRFAGKTDQALVASQRMLSLALAAADGNAANAQVLEARMSLGSIYTDLGRPADAVREISAAVAGAPHLYGPDSSFEMFAHSNLARARYESGNLVAALAEIDRTLEVARLQPDEESRNSGIATAIRAHILLASQRYPEALAGFDKALVYYRENFGPEHYATVGLRIDRDLALAHLGRHAEALSELRPLAGQWPTLKHWMVVSPLYAVGVSERLAGQADAGLATQRTALASLPEGPRRDFLRMAVLGEIGLCALQAGLIDEAERTLREALALHVKLESAVTPARIDVERALARAQRARTTGT